MEMIFQQLPRALVDIYKSFLYSKRPLFIDPTPSPISEIPDNLGSWEAFYPELCLTRQSSAVKTIFVKSESVRNSSDFQLRLKTRVLGGTC